jgi:hypothetical protein
MKYPIFINYWGHKKFKYLVLINNNNYQKNQMPNYYIYNHGSFLLKIYIHICLKPSGLCRFFHETQWFFEVLEIPGTGDSLILNFSNTQNRRVSQKSNTG